MDKQTFSDITNEIFELHKAKGGDYGSEKAYFPFGAQSYVQMLHVKVQRLVSLTASGNMPNFESLEDTAKDLTLYSIFLLGFLKGDK